MKKYYAIDSAFKFKNKETWETMYSLRLIQQSTRFNVRGSTSKYFDEQEFKEIFWDKIDEKRDSLGLGWLYLVATEGIELTKEKRQWYWIKNYTIEGISSYISKEGVNMVAVSCLYDTDYSVNDLRKFYMTKQEYNDFFEDVLDIWDQFHVDGLKWRNLQVIEQYSYIEDLPIDFDTPRERN